jgi:hypothetical protein
MKTIRIKTRGRVVKVYSPKERRLLLADFSRSRESRPEYCRRKKIAYSTFCGWAGEAKRSKKPLFKKVELSPWSSMGDQALAEICMSAGVRVKVMAPCSKNKLMEILEVIKLCGR